MKVIIKHSINILLLISILLSTSGLNILMQKCNTCNHKNVQINNQYTDNCQTAKYDSSACDKYNTTKTSCCNTEHVYIKNNTKIIIREDSKTNQDHLFYFPILARYIKKPLVLHTTHILPYQFFLKASRHTQAFLCSFLC